MQLKTRLYLFIRNLTAFILILLFIIPFVIYKIVITIPYVWSTTYVIMWPGGWMKR